MTKITEIEGRIDALKADRAAREARLAQIGPEAEAFRAKLRRARGEADLGDATAKKTAADLERHLAALAGEEDAAIGATEILAERIALADVELAVAKADQKAVIAEACRAAEESAFEEFCAAMASSVGPLGRMAAACRIAEAHGAEVPGRGRVHAIRGRLAAAGVATEREEGWGRRARKVHIAAAPGIPEELRTEKFKPGLAAALATLVAELQHAGLPINDVKLPEPVQEATAEGFFFVQAEPPKPASPPSETIHMGRGAPVEVDAVGRPVAQSARPPADYRGERRQSSPRVVADFLDPRTARGS